MKNYVYNFWGVLLLVVKVSFLSGMHNAHPCILCPAGQLQTLLVLSVLVFISTCKMFLYYSVGDRLLSKLVGVD